MQALSEPDPLTVALSRELRECIKTMVTTELTEVLVAVRYARGPSRRGDSPWMDSAHADDRAWARRR